ncbi:MAG TPA: AI-2E family transporter [Terriglobales bacterium]|nr:AI-2E family transporter [Terriglobales bacterium]
MAANPAEFSRQSDDESAKVAEAAAQEPGVPTGPTLAPPTAVPVADQRSSSAQWIIALAALIAGLYFAKLVLVVVLISILLAFVLAPLVDLLSRIRVPHWAGALISVLLFCAAIYGIANVSYNKAVSFAEELPKYRVEIQHLTWKFRQKEQLLEKSTNQVLPASKDRGQKVVAVEQEHSLSRILSSNLGTATELALAASFIPFLSYFMLSWQEHARSATVLLFPREERSTAYATLGAIVKMVRAFIVGNLIVGLVLGAVSTIVFGFLHLPYFYFLGFISGFLSLVPYLGPLLAIVPPVLSGFGHIHGSSFIVILIAVFGLHIFAMNVLYPKFLGSRLQLNPLAVTLALLFWGWLWGAMGLLLAIPITAALKIICDHVPRFRAYGLWLSE